MPLRPEWLNDPRDGIAHAWRDHAGTATSACQRHSIRANLVTPEDEYGRCQECVRLVAIDLGAQIAEQQAPGTEWR